MKKRFFSLLLVLAMVLSLLPVTTFAADIVDSGTCGNNLTWTLDSDGVLTISGTGAMRDYDYETGSEFPNYQEASINRIVIRQGVTSIGDFAFYYCSAPTSVTIPNSVTRIGHFAFAYWGSDINVFYDGTVQQWESISFRESRERGFITGTVQCRDGIAKPRSVRSTVELNGDKAPNGNRDGETNLGDLVADALVWFVLKDTKLKVPVENVVGVTNGGGIRAWIHAGDVTMKDINTVLPFGNTVTVVYVTGAQLLEALEASTFKTPEASGAFPQVSGMKFTLNTGKAFDQGEQYPDSTYYGPRSIQRVTINEVNGKPFDKNAVYAVVTNDFCAAGGDTYHAFKAASNQFDTGIQLDDALMNYIEEKLGGVIGSDYAAPQGRIVIVDQPTGQSDPVDPTEPTFENIEGKPITSETEISFNYNISETSKRGTWHLPYADSFLSGSAKEFHQDLAIISLGLTMASSNQKEGDHHTGAAYLQAMLEKMGFDKSSVQVSKSYADTQKQTDTCEYAFAVKKLVNSDDYVVCAVVRSNGYGGEWISNAHVYNGVNANHSAGFKGAADGMYTALQKYLRQINVDKSHIRLWVTGFSRGGAVANLLGARLTEEIGISADKIFVYGFAVPRTVQKNVKVRYENIFNIINQCDLVPRVPLQSWGYERCGIDRFLPCVSRNPGWYSSVRTEMEKYFNKMMNLSVPTTIYSLMPAQERALDVLLAYLSDIIPSVYSYRDDGYQNAVMHACKGWQIEGEEISIDYILYEVFGLPAGYAKTLVGLFDDWSKQDKKEKALSVLAAIDLLKDWKDENGTEQAKRVASALIGYFTRLKAYEEADLINGAPYRELINLISDQIARAKEERAFASALLMQHWPETYLSWMMAGDEDEVYFNSTYKIMYIKCPVDVTVYDGNNRVAARIVNDQVDESVDGLYCEVNEYGEKMIFLPDDTSYRTVITAREKGDMDIVVQEYSAEDTLIDADCYIQLPMEERQTFQVNTETDCTVVTNGATLDPSNTLTGNNQTVTIRATAQTGGSVIGAKDYSLGDTAELIAIPDQDYSFTGWYDGSRLLSTEEMLHFSAVTGRSLTAKFERTTPLPSNPFTDVKESAYYYEPVLWAVNHVPQITNGTGDKTFSPEWECLRCQIVTFLWRAMGCPEPTSTVNPFVDVKPSDYFYKAVLWAVEKGITNGMDLTHFGPNLTCTRGQAVTFLWRAEGKPAPRTQRSEFTDVQNPNDYFYTPVLWAVENGITNGTGNGMFSPNMICLREQIVTFLYRDLK